MGNYLFYALAFLFFGYACAMINSKQSKQLEIEVMKEENLDEDFFED
jgi:hypothetical protein